MTVLTMTPAQAAILEEIRRHTRQDPITRRDLAAKLGLADRPMRIGIEVLAKTFLLPIGRGPNGYFWRASIEDDLVTFDLLVKKIRAMAAECKLIKKQMACRRQGHLDLGSVA